MPASLRFLRRHARALTGSRYDGDMLVDEANVQFCLLKTRDADQAKSHRDLFRIFYELVGVDGAGQIDRAALLLTSIEGFSLADIAVIMQQPLNEIKAAHQRGRKAADSICPINILVIEDEPIQAMDLSHQIADLGHIVCGVAMTHADAVNMANDAPPDLVISDIALADKSSGIDAVRQIISNFGGLPVIFITGHPEFLLDGRKDEPVFLIKKPFREDQLESAILQALMISDHGE